ncbi:probable disease resistance protein At4g27220 [Hibiscus syriacus]|uniref:probable disease resistance protein At4g27220 n=1 Tax=Hibiscus syriacus TaxID=106335 RepID=UPI001920B4CD|nr:probable disease resistance protein At4g27220 [Hibiscus syriacus]
MDALKVLDLSRNPIKSLPISLSKCPWLTTLLFCHCLIESIPESFFDDTNELKILDLSFNPIKSLPHSLSNLKNLTSLLLADCEDLGNFPSLSNLGVLEKLDLRRTKIKEIPNGVLSRLCCLHELIVGGTLINGKEVGGLKKLHGTLEGRFYDWHDLNMYLQACRGREEPRKYIIYVGDARYLCFMKMQVKKLFEEYPLFSRFILFSIGSFSSLKCLDMYDCGNMKKLFSPNCVPLNLQELSVGACKQLEEIITSEVEQEERGMFITEFHLPQLRLLWLSDLPELKSICSAGGVLVCDSLGEIGIENCPRLKRMSLNVPKLDNVPPSASASANFYLSVRIRPKKWWESVEWDGPQPKSLLDPFEIITSDVEAEERGMVTMEFHLPRLRVLLLKHLPELRCICCAEGVMICDSLDKISVQDCPKLNRMALQDAE